MRSGPRRFPPPLLAPPPLDSDPTVADPVARLRLRKTPAARPAPTAAHPVPNLRVVDRSPGHRTGAGHNGHVRAQRPRWTAGALDFRLVSHPSLGLPPRDLTAGYPADAAAIRAAAPRLAARALERAVDADADFRDRYSDLALRELLADTEALTDRLATAVASADPTVLGSLAEHLAPRYRKRNVPLDDVIALCKGVRLGATAAASPAAGPAIDAAIDAALKALRWHRRLAGDARKRNPFIAFIYKGA